MTDNIQAIENILQQINKGLDPVKAKELFQKELGKVSASDLAQAENALLESGLPMEDFQKLCKVHASVMDEAIEKGEKELAPSHPLELFHLENMAFKGHLNQRLKPDAKNYLKEPSQRGQDFLLQDLEKMKALSIHYDRKEQLIFPILEEKSIKSIPQVMWAVDDEIRQSLKDLLPLVKKKDPSKEDLRLMEEKLQAFFSEAEEMIKKEEDILTPLLKENLEDHHWLSIAQETKFYPIQMLDSHPEAQIESQEKWIEENSHSAAENISPGPKPMASSQSPSQGLSLLVNFPTGQLKEEELEAIFSTFPMELTFTDKNDNVAYFSQGSNMVFPRPMTALGRNVLLCHPPKAVPIVKKLLEDFREGNKDQEIRWLKKGEDLILIRYMALRNSQGHYQGCLELVENISQIPGAKERIL